MLDENDLQDLKEGWKIGFGDDDEFIDHFFARYDSDDTRMIERREEGNIIAQLHYFLFDDDVCGEKGCYIYGVTTLPECRGKGIASGIIEQLLNNLRADGVAYAVLIAENEALQRWYESLGFVKRSQIIEVKGQDDNMNFTMDDISKNQGMYYIFNSEISGFTTNIQLLTPN